MRLDFFAGAGAGAHPTTYAPQFAGGRRDLEGHVLIGSDGLTYVATVETTRAAAEAVVGQLNELGSDAWESFVHRAKGD